MCINFNLNLGILDKRLEEISHSSVKLPVMETDALKLKWVGARITDGITTDYVIEKFVGEFVPESINKIVQEYFGMNPFLENAHQLLLSMNPAYMAKDEIAKRDCHILEWIESSRQVMIVSELVKGIGMFSTERLQNTRFDKEYLSYGEGTMEVVRPVDKRKNAFQEKVNFVDEVWRNHLEFTERRIVMKMEMPPLQVSRKRLEITKQYLKDILEKDHQEIDDPSNSQQKEIITGIIKDLFLIGLEDQSAPGFIADQFVKSSLTAEGLKEKLQNIILWPREII